MLLYIKFNIYYNINFVVKCTAMRTRNWRYYRVVITKEMFSLQKNIEAPN